MTKTDLIDIKGKLKPANIVGSGGEADIYKLTATSVAKIFKPPNHPDLLSADEKKAAKEKIEEQQLKLPKFPQSLPKEVVIPDSLIVDNNKIIGYTMKFIANSEPLIRFSERPFRQNIDTNLVLNLFMLMHKVIIGIHTANVVIGDFNDLNIMVNNFTPYFLDADSFQFDTFLCKMFTSRFVDPLLCDPKQRDLMLIKPHNADSDWYAFAIMLMQSLLFVGPYGGVYLPNNPKNKINPGQRPLKRITVFNPEVKYPRPSIPYKVLPDDFLNYLHLIFEKDKRGIFPDNLLVMRWTKCTNCGTEHARAVCPNCAAAPPIAVKTTIIVHGKVTITKIFETTGTILFCTSQDKLRWLYWDQSSFKREDGGIVFKGNINPYTRYRINQDTTLFGIKNQIQMINQNGTVEKLYTDSFNNLAMFDANKDNVFWLENGRLLKNGQFGQTFIGNTLPNQTLFWVGSTFGFGFYRAGGLNVSFVFDTTKQGINDNVKIPAINGTLIDSTCTFSSDLCWFFMATQEGPKIFHYCFVITKRGEILASLREEKQDGKWLSSFRGKCATGNFLFSMSDEGIVRLSVSGGQIIEDKIFKDTDFIDPSSYLFLGKEGLYVVDKHEISLVQIS